MKLLWVLMVTGGIASSAWAWESAKAEVVAARGQVCALNRWLEQNASPMMRMFSIDPHSSQVPEVCKSRDLGVGIMDSVFRTAGRASQEPWIDIPAIADRWKFVHVLDRFCRHVISPSD